MLVRGYSVGIVAFLSLASIAAYQPQQRAPHGVVAKAGPAFSWLKKLDQAELADVHERCQHTASVLQANESVVNRIIGGQLASVGQFPYAAALGDSLINVSLCGATLISPRHLLTAAHCVRTDMSGKSATTQTVRLGGVCCYTSPEDNCPAQDMFEVEMELAAKVYYSYSARDKRTTSEQSKEEPADLALVQLREPIGRRFVKSGRVDYACLPPPPSKLLPQSLYNFGWGLHRDLDSSSFQFAARLRFVRLLTRPRDEWSPEIRHIKGCEMSRSSPRLCLYPPGRAEAAPFSADSGSGALAKKIDGVPANADVLYAVLSSVFSASYSINASDKQEPYMKRILGRDVSVQYHLDDLCYYLQLGCGVWGVTGMETTLRLSSFYLKRKRSVMPAIAPFTPLSEEEPYTQHNMPEQAVAALVDVASGGKAAVICLAIVISPRHLVTSRKCIMDKYLLPWKEQKRERIGFRPLLLWIAPANSSIKDVEFIAWQRTIAAATQDQKAAGSDMVIIQLASPKMFSNQ